MKMQLYVIILAGLSMLLSACTMSGNITSTEAAGGSSNISKLRVYFQTTDVTLSEGSFGLFNILTDEKMDEDVIVELSLVGPVGRFQTLPSQLIIPKGSISASFTLQTIEDSVYQGNVDFTLRISSPNSSLNIDPGLMTVHLVDNDLVPSVSIGSATVSEAVGSASVAISLSGLSAQDVQVNWATSNGTALAGTNYTGSSGTATIAAGSLTTNINIPILNTPAVCEGNRSFVVTLSNPVHATISSSTGSVTVTEDDLPIVSVANATVNEGAIGAITVSLSQPCPTSAVTVSYTMADGTATAGDYVGSSGSFAIPAGQTSALLGVTTLEDVTPYEGSETFSLTISNPVNAALGATVTSVVTILDNDTYLASANNISAISAGPRHTCVIRNGGAYCWGTNGNGELGNGTTTPSYIPVGVSGLSAGVTKIVSSGFMYSDTRTAERSCAIVSGAAKCWGYQSVGELGNNGGSTSSSTPVAVAGLSGGVTDIDTSEAGYQGFVCAVHNGAAKCWGWNGNGQLGDGTTTPSATPVTVSGLSSGVVAIATGEAHACAVLSDGTIKCWGLNNLGQLGDNSTVNSLTPVTVSGIASGATKISVGYRHSCALVSGGVKCWGYNNYGQLGNGTVVNSSVPVDATGLTSGVVDVATSADTIGGYALSCAIDSAGAVKCWGTNYSGQVGDGTLTQKSVPTQVVGLTSGFTRVSVSPATACAVTSGGKAYCWGDMTSGQAGNDLGGFVYKPVDPVGMSAGVTGLSTGHFHGCAINSGALKCWGNNNTGNLGNGNTTSQSVPVSVVGMNSGVTSVSANSDVANNFRHTCAVQNGAAFCWGDNNWGQLGNGVTGGSSSVPVQVSGLTSGVLSISASMLHTCAVMISGAVKCWGDNTYGQLGNNSTTLSNVPVNVSGITAATEIAIASRHSCAIDASGMKCWGYNNFGQLGDGTTNTSLIPVVPTGLSSGVTSISVQGANGSNEVTCAVVNGSAKCWGAGYYGSLGTGNGSDQHSPAQVAGYSSGVKKITSFSSGGCLLTTTNAVVCWGTNNYLVVAPTLNVSVAYSPVAVGFAPAGVTDISGGGYGMCLITTSQSLKCWGYLAQTGSGYLFHYFSTPVEVLFTPPTS